KEDRLDRNRRPPRHAWHARPVASAIAAPSLAGAQTFLTVERRHGGMAASLNELVDVLRVSKQAIESTSRWVRPPMWPRCKNSQDTIASKFHHPIFNFNRFCRSVDMDVFSGWPHIRVVHRFCPLRMKTNHHGLNIPRALKDITNQCFGRIKR